MNSRKAVTLLLAYLAGCAADPQTQIVWAHNSLSGQPAQARFITDRAECAAYAINLAPLPQEPRMPVYTSSDQPVTILTPSGPVMGIVHQDQPYQPLPTVMDYSNYQNARNAAVSQQRQLFGACMYQRDWRAEQVVSGTQSPTNAATGGSGDGPFRAESRQLNQSCNSNSDCVGQLRCEYGRCKVP